MSTQVQQVGMMENYKGIMLCSRPQDQINLDQNKPFISRVHYDEPIGYNPVQKFVSYKAQKNIKPVLRKHKQWLNEYSIKMRNKFNEDQNNETTKQKSIKPKRKDHTNEAVDFVDLTVPHQNESVEQRAPNKESIHDQKKQKPQWALSQSQSIEKEVQKEEKEVDDLIDFAKGLDYNSYIDDLEVKVMLEALKQRVKEIQSNDVERINILAQPRQYDTQSEYNKKTQLSAADNNEDPQRPIKKTKFAEHEREDWDKSTTINEQKQSIEETLAKHIAQEILKKNKHLRGFHSKLSLQRVLEMEAQQQLKNG